MQSSATHQVVYKVSTDLVVSSVNVVFEIFSILYMLLPCNVIE